MSDVNVSEGEQTGVTEDDVQAAREEVDALRQELAEVTQQTAQVEADRTQDIRKAALDREAASLRQQIETARSNLEVAQADQGPLNTDGSADVPTDVTGVPVGSQDQPDVNAETGEVEADQVHAFMAHAMGEDYDPDSDGGSSLADATDDEQ